MALSHREWAEKHVVLGAGPYKGHPFRVDRQPIIGLLFDEFDRGCWNEIYISGPSQSSKSLCGFVIPTLRDVHELRLDALVGTPEADMMSDKWDKDFLPVMESSPALRSLIPTSGPGSKGGRIKDRITLGGGWGVDIKVMTRGGRDTNKAGYSSPRPKLTEAAGWSKNSETSVEGGSFRQILARMRAFKLDDPRRQLIVEGTFTIPEELPACARGEDDDERLISTRSQIVSPCPHCGEFIAPGRTLLVGWQEAETEPQVKDQATWLCPSCSNPINDAQRRESLLDCRLLHWGQKIDKRGRVTGPVPPTSTLWFSWSAWHNLLLDAADIAMDEWNAMAIEEGTQERDDAERALCQFTHGMPFKSTLADNEPLKATNVRKRTDTWKRNVLPHDTVKVTIGVDIGDWTAWWFLIAHRADGQKHVAAYGAFDVKRSKGDDLGSRIIASLHDFADTIVEQGFPQEGTDGHYIPDVVWIDGGYRPDDVAEFIRQRGGIKQRRYWLVRGRGKSVGGSGYNHPKKVTFHKTRIGLQWFAEVNHKRRILEVTFNADYWKMDVDAKLRTSPGKKGAMTFSVAELKNEHAKLSNHLCNEQFKREWVPGKGLVDKWVKTGDQHWKDAAAMSLGAGDMAGVSLLDAPNEPPDEEKRANDLEYVPPGIDKANWYAAMLGVQ